MSELVLIYVKIEFNSKLKILQMSLIWFTIKSEITFIIYSILILMKLIIIFYILQALTLCSVLLFYFGILSSISPNYTWLLVLRGLVGFAIGCSPQSYVKIIIFH